MKVLFNVVTIIIQFNQIMTAAAVANLDEETKYFTNNERQTIFNDNPNSRQALLSQTFISSAENLFNSGMKSQAQYAANQWNEFNGKPNIARLMDKYRQFSKVESAGKDKEENVGYYSMDVGGGSDVDLEKMAEHPLVDGFASPLAALDKNNRFTRFSEMLPVQCMKTSPEKLFCVHGNIIYKIRLPRTDISEEEIGTLVETVYREIEVKKKGTFLERIKKRDLTNDAAINLVLPAVNGSNIMEFSMPKLYADGESSEELTVGAKSNKKKEYVNEMPYEFVPENSDNSYSSKWLSKRAALRRGKSKHIMEKRRPLPPSCMRPKPTQRRPSINEGKTGKCHLPKNGEHRCVIKPACACTHEWTPIPAQTTCPPLLVPLDEFVASTRCPALHFTTETCATARTKTTTNSEMLSTADSEAAESNDQSNGDEMTTDGCPPTEIVQYRKKLGPFRRIRPKMLQKRDGKRRRIFVRRIRT